MNSNFTWILLLIMQLVCVAPRAIEVLTPDHNSGRELPYRSNYSNSNSNENLSKGKEKVISVRYKITSSVAIGRGKGPPQRTTIRPEPITEFSSPLITSTSEIYHDYDTEKNNVPKNLEGANIEYLKQLEAKRKNEVPNLEQIHPFQVMQPLRYNRSENNDEILDYVTRTDEVDDISASDNMESSSQDVNYYKELESKEIESSILHEALKYSEKRLTSNATFDDLLPKVESKKNTFVTSSSIEMDESYFNLNVTDTDDSIAEPSTKELEISDKDNENYENVENVPLARSVVQSPSSKNFIQGLANKPPSERESSTRLTTISFNVVHDAPRPKINGFSDSNSPFERHKLYIPPKVYSQPEQIYSQPEQIYSQPEKIYSEPAKIYGEPAKIYSEPAKVYSEPAKVYSEPSKVYSEPAKVYSVPSKFYSEPASLHLTARVPPNYSSWPQHTQPPSTTRILNTTPLSTIAIPGVNMTTRIAEHLPEKNYEVDEKVSVLTDGRSHGVQEATTEKCKQENCKVGYVVKGRQFNKYRVEERTSDGFIVGEYGVVRNEDGALRGVRYTADGDASPSLIHDALMKFLQLK